ncbi:MAG: hypothetical protein DMG79_01585 [Acidobacteria bacterium]|nr:MAG: hypothetical protein DMG79_01585 [Acidobacteriota bacterium]
MREGNFWGAAWQRPVTCDTAAAEAFSALDDDPVEDDADMAKDESANAHRRRAVVVWELSFMIAASRGPKE